VKERIRASFQGRAPPEVFPFMTRILAVDSGKVVHATTTVRTSRSLESNHPCWFVSNYGDTSISGVPGSSSPVEITSPLQGNILPTGRVLDMVSIDDHMVPCTIVDTGLPSIFVPSTFVSDTLRFFSLHPADLDADLKLRTQMERLRYTASQLDPALSAVFSPSAPKVCVVGPPVDYRSSSGVDLRANQMDCVVRAVSVGNFHRTVPATMLSALAAASTLPGSVVWNACQQSMIPQTNVKSSRSIIVGQPAGLSRANVALNPDGNPESVKYIRTARRLFRGEVLVKA